MKIEDNANTTPEQRVTPPPSVIDRACKIAAASPCRSKRGAVIFGWSVGILFIAGSGHNGPPGPFTCPGRELCSRNCGQRSVHAEARALRDAADYHDLELDLVHVELADDGRVVVCDGPSCWQCAREILDVGFIAGVWLYEDTRPRCQREPMALRYHWRIDETGTRIDCPGCGGSGRVGQSAGTWRRYAAEEFYRLALERCGIQPLARMPLPSAAAAALCPHCETALQGFIHRLVLIVGQPDGWIHLRLGHAVQVHGAPLCEVPEGRRCSCTQCRLWFQPSTRLPPPSAAATALCPHCEAALPRFIHRPVRISGRPDGWAHLMLGHAMQVHDTPLCEVSKEHDARLP